MSAKIPDAQDTAVEIQRLYDASLPELLTLAKSLIESLPAKNPPFVRFVYFSTAERIFLLVQDVHENFMTSLETGYFTSAALTRNLMEATTLLALLNRDNTGELHSAFLEKQEKDATRRRNDLTRMGNSANSNIARASKIVAGTAERVVQVVKQVRQNSALPKASQNFPNMLERCEQLGENWELMYHAVYRDLCEAVHGSFLKTAHAPVHAFSSASGGAALLYEHCRTMSYAVEFWGIAMLECCSNHPNANALATFRDKLGVLLHKDAIIFNSFPENAKVHEITF